MAAEDWGAELRKRVENYSRKIDPSTAIELGILYTLWGATHGESGTETSRGYFERFYNVLGAAAGLPEYLVENVKKEGEGPCGHTALMCVLKDAKNPVAGKAIDFALHEMYELEHRENARASSV
jgi:hypothetical protein